MINDNMSAIAQVFVGSNPTLRTIVVLLLAWLVSSLISNVLYGGSWGGGGGLSSSLFGCFGDVRLLVWLNGCGVVLSVGGLEGGCRVGGFPLPAHDVF